MRYAYLLQEGDGTAFSAPAQTVAIALTEEVAKQWKAACPKGVWVYRNYYPQPLIDEVVS